MNRRKKPTGIRRYLLLRTFVWYLVLVPLCIQYSMLFSVPCTRYILIVRLYQYFHWLVGMFRSRSQITK